MIKQIDIRRLTDQGPAILGDLIVAGIVKQINMHYDSPSVDIDLPMSFSLPDQPITVALYADGKYFGMGILDSDGFHAHPDSSSASPYFTITFAQTPAPDVLRTGGRRSA